MSTLELIFGAAIVPLALLAVVAAFGWRYRQLVRAAMSKSAGPDALGATPAAIVAAPPPLTISRVDATDAPTPAGDAAIALADAAATTRKFRRVLIAAALTYILAIEAALIPFMTQALEAKVVAALMLPIPGLFVLLSFLRASWRQWLLIGAGYPMLAFAVATAAVGYERTYALVGALQVLLVLTPLGGLVLLVVRRLQPLLAILVAIIVYVSAGAAIALVLGWDQAVGPLGNQPPLLLAMAAAVHVLGLIIFGWLLRRQRIAWPVAGLVAMAVAGVSIDRLLQPSFPIGPLLVGLAGSVLQFSLVWGLFKLFVRLEDATTFPIKCSTFIFVGPSSPSTTACSPVQARHSFAAASRCRWPFSPTRCISSCSMSRCAVYGGRAPGSRRSGCCFCASSTPQTNASGCSSGSTTRGAASAASI
jgi:hypothetical protein